MTVSRVVDALVHLIDQAPHVPLPEGAELDLSGAPDSVAAVVTALATHRPPTHLGTWELGLLGEDHARKVMDLAGGGGELATKFVHYRAIGQHNGEVHLVLGWNTGEGALHEVIEVDPEYGKVESLRMLPTWLTGLFKSDAAAAEALGGAFETLEAPSGDDLDAVDEADFKARRRAPADPEALIAGGHLYFSVADDGTAVSVHKKGLRYLDAKGKRKAKNAGSVGKYGAITPEGHAGWFLPESGPLLRVALPAGKPTVEYDRARALAVLRDDRIVLHTDNTLTLYRVEGDQLEVLHELVSLDLGDFGTVMQSAFRGRGVVVHKSMSKVTWVFEVVDDRLVPRWRLTGDLHSAFNDVTEGVVDADEDTVLVKTKWPHGRITAVPRRA